MRSVNDLWYKKIAKIISNEQLILLITALDLRGLYMADPLDESRNFYISKMICICYEGRNSIFVNLLRSTYMSNSERKINYIVAAIFTELLISAFTLKQSGEKDTKEIFDKMFPDFKSVVGVSIDRVFGNNIDFLYNLDIFKD